VILFFILMTSFTSSFSWSAQKGNVNKAVPKKQQIHCTNKKSLSSPQ